LKERLELIEEEKVTGKDSSGEFQKQVRDKLDTQRPLGAWLRWVFSGGKGKHFKQFWNLDGEKSKGALCEVVTHKWKFLLQFLADTDKSIQACVEYPKHQGAQEGPSRNVRWEVVEETAPPVLILQWDHEGNPGKKCFAMGDSKVTYLEGAPDYCTVLSETAITQGRHAFEFVMHKIGDEQWCGVTADKTLAGTTSDLRRRAQCWTYYCGCRHADGGILSDENEETMQLEHIKDGDKIGLAVDFDTRTLSFLRNGTLQGECSFPSDAVELYLSTHLDYTGDCVELVTLAEEQLHPPVLCCGGNVDGVQPSLHASMCRKDALCEACCADNDFLLRRVLSNVVGRLDRSLQTLAKDIADIKFVKQAHSVCAKNALSIPPAVSENTDMLGRAEAAINGLPAELMAEPQCCRRLMAAVAGLAAARCALQQLPQQSQELPLGTRTHLLVPPFAELAYTPHLMRCMQLLEVGAARSFKTVELKTVELKLPPALMVPELVLSADIQCLLYFGKQGSANQEFREL